MLPDSQHKQEGCYAFGPFVLDVDRTALYRSEEFIPLTPKVFDTLLALVSDSGRILTKNELVERVWPDSAVGDGSLAQNILVLRRILDPYFPGESPIATVPKRGYRFIAPVTRQTDAAPPVVAPLTTQKIEHVSAPRMNRLRITLIAGTVAAFLLLVFAIFRTGVLTRPAAKRKSIAVLALKNLTARPESEWYSTALAETIAGELGAGGDLRIIASDNVRRMQQELSLPGVLITPGQMKDIRNDIGCDLVLSGSYLTMGQNIRVELMLSDAHSNDTIASITDTDDQAKLLEMVSRTSEKLREKLALHPLQRAQEQRLQHSMSANAQANRFYFDGLAALKLGDGPEAQKQLSLAVETDPQFALAHSALSQAWNQLGYNARARTEAKLALDLAGSDQSREDHLVMEAGYDTCLADWKKAGETYRSLWQFFPDNMEYGLTLAQVEYSAGRPAEALKVVKQLRALPAPDGQDPRIDLLESRGAQLGGDFHRSYGLASEAARKAGEVKARVLAARARMLQGVSANRLGRLEEARRSYAEAKALFEAVGDTGNAADALQADANNLRALGRIDASIAESEAALAMSRKVGFTRLTSQILAGYSNTLIRKGALEKARKASEEALELNSEINDVGVSFSARMDRGRIAKAQGRYLDARADFADSARIAKQAGYRLNETNSESTLGLVDAGLGRLTDAHRELEEVVAQRRALGNRRGVALSLADLAVVVHAQGDLAGAQRLTEEECSIDESLQLKQDLAECREEMAQVFWDEGRKQDTRTLLQKLQADFPPDSLGPLQLANLATLQFETGDTKGAKAALALAQRKMLHLEKMPESSLLLELTSARVNGSSAQMQQVAAEAARLGLASIALEARLALLEMSTHRQTAAEELAAEANQKGFGLIAKKAAFLAHHGE